MSGTISGADGTPLSGATVKISYADAGINKTILTQNNGSFVIPNLRVGGPYKVTASYVGYQEKTEDDIILTLGRIPPLT